MEKLTKTQWAEIAVVSFLLALLLWLVSQSTPVEAPQANDSLPFMPTTSGDGTPITIDGVPSIGFVPTPLPGNSSHNCGCNGCAAGSTSNISIANIVAQSNAALASLIDAEQVMANYLAQFNQSSASPVVF